LWSWGRGLVRAILLADGGGHDVGRCFDDVFLLGGDVKVSPAPLLLLYPGENPKSSVWVAATFWHLFPLAGAISGLLEGFVR
jgi:hypothetical protein